jgi:membrane-bound lytic murein transglycosylase F
MLAGVRTGLLVLAFVAAGAASPSAQGSLDRYDHVFRKYSKRYFGPGHDWRVFKAQGMAESNLNPSANSHVGARGIMQLMPSTFGAIQSRQPGFVSIDDPEWNIAAGILHDRQMWKLWSDSVEMADQRDFMLGSYNAGRSTLLRAQGVARSSGYDGRTWAGIVAVAPEVPRWRHQETLGYVQRIEGNMLQLDERGRVRPTPATASPLTPGSSVIPSQTP